MFSETKSGRADEAHVVDEVERDPTDDVADHDVRQRGRRRTENATELGDDRCTTASRSSCALGRPSPWRPTTCRPAYSVEVTASVYNYT